MAAGVMAAPDRLSEVLAAVRPDELPDAVASAVLAAAAALAATRVPARPDAVFAHLRRHGRLADLGPAPAAELAALADRDPTGAGLDHAIERYRRAVAARSLDSAAASASTDVRATRDPDAALDRLARTLGELSGAGAGDPPAFADLLDAACDRIDARQTGRATEDRVPTGLSGLDQTLGRLKPGALYVVAGRPGGGKSSLALGAALHAGAAGFPAYFASLEMTRDDLTDRALAMLSGVPLQQVTGRGRLDGDLPARIDGARAALRRVPLWIDDAPGRTAAQVAAAARAVRRRKVRLAVVDYLGLLRPEDAKAPRHLQVGRDAWRLKLLARELNVPVLLLCQLNRESENRPDPRPRLADLRDSGEIEQHADAVVGLHADPATAGQPVQRVTAIVLKQRNGPTGDVPLDYLPANVRFTDPGIPS